METYIVSTASAVTVLIFADIAATTRKIFRRLDSHNDRITVLETRCEDHHEKPIRKTVEG